MCVPVRPRPALQCTAKAPVSRSHVWGTHTRISRTHRFVETLTMTYAKKLVENRIAWVAAVWVFQIDLFHESVSFDHS